MRRSSRRVAAADQRIGSRPDLLPEYATTFFGRRAELSAIEQAFTQRGARLVTLLGAGGVGKTRLAREHARAVVARGEVRFAELTEATTPVGVCHAVAVALDVALDRGTDADELADAVGAALAGRGPMLLVLDNLEHVAAHAPSLLGRWLRAAPELRLLATSRTRLSLSAESVLEVGPLELPEDGQAAGASDAVQLFVDRAKHARASFSPTEAEQSLLAALVRRLDGWPLAIELAAARISLLSLDDLSRALEHRFELLRASVRDVPERHRTLERTIGWSWDLLNEAERRALAECSVFRDGFTLDAARAVLSVGERRDVLDLLESLRDVSLLNTETSTQHPGLRFRLYESVREFAGQRLVGEALVETQRRHAEHFASWGEALAQKALVGSAREEARRRLLADLDNLALAHAWPLSTEGLDVETRARLALRAALGLGAVFAARGPNRSYLDTFDRALTAAAHAAEPTAPTDVARHAHAHLGRAEARLRHGRVEDAREDLDRAADLARVHGDPALSATVALSSGGWAWLQGLFDESAREAERALTLARRGGARALEARALDDLARIAVLRGDLDRARETCASALALHRELEDQDGALRAAFTQAEIAMDGGAAEEARVLHEGVLARSRVLGDSRIESASMLSLAALAQHEGRFEIALALYDDALALLRSVGIRSAESLTLAYRAACLEEAGRIDDARASYGQAIALARASGNRLVEGLALAWLARLAADADDASTAEVHIEAGARLLEDIGDDVRGEVVAICRDHIALARARTLEEKRPSEARAVRAAVRAHAASVRAARTGSSWDVKSALGFLQRAMPEAPSEVTDAAARLEIARSGKWFRVDGVVVDLARHGALTLIVELLASRAVSAPGQPASVEALFAAGWPGQRAHPRSVSSRVYTAIATLRRLGLRDMLARHHDGYLLDPKARVAIVEEHDG